MGLDYLACAQVEAAYNAFVNLLDQIIEFPLALLKALRNVIKMLESTIYKGIEDAFGELIDLFDTFLKFPANTDSVTDAFCEAILQCEFLYKSMLPAATNGTYYDPLTGDYVTGYEWFKRNICSNGLGDYMDILRQQAIDNINNLIDIIQGNIGKGFIFINQQIDGLVEQYNKFITRPITDYFPLFDNIWSALLVFNWIPTDTFDPSTASILDVIKLIELFGQCIFSVCDLSVTVQNKLDDIGDKLSINIGSGQYVPNNSQITMKTAEKNMDDKIKTISASI
tara:strand:- start:10715 stop:11560 length:846 start_codon:yes stop_codon:yes gene_type:complete